MAAKYVDLRGERDMSAARDKIITAAMLEGVEVRTNVSTSGLMLYGDEHRINVVLHIFDGRDIPALPYDPEQAGDTEDDI